jgi:hypothetical protein
MTLGMSVLEHLGLNPYSNLPAVIGEAVANAWDADAAHVEILIDAGAGVIRVKDDGDSLPSKVANDPLVRGRAGAPNRWAIPQDLHKEIHKGAGGGAYNTAWKQQLGDLGRDPTVDDVIAVRDRLAQDFGLEPWRP